MWKIYLFISILFHRRVEIHRVILAAMSNYFERNLGNTSDEIEVVLDGVDGKFINEIVSFSYTGNIDIRQENVRELLDFATNYEFKLLHEKCVEFCVHQLGANNCIQWFAYADKKNIEDLRRNAFQMICANFENISPSDMCELGFENFKEIIETGDNMAREECIFDRMVQWIQFDALGRSGYAFELLQCIRLKHIPEKVQFHTTKDMRINKINETRILSTGTGWKSDGILPES